MVVGFFEHDRWVINVPTKKHWRSRSRLAEVEAGLVALCAFVVAHNIASVAVPPLGCGHGGLVWVEVRAVMLRVFATLPADVEGRPKRCIACRLEKKNRRRAMHRLQARLLDYDPQRATDLAHIYLAMGAKKKAALAAWRFQAGPTPRTLP